METLDGWKILILGGMLVAGFLAHLSGPLIHVPRVTLLMLIGAIFGPGVLGIVPAEITDWFPFVAQQQLPDYGDRVLTVVIATTVRFEVTGPLLARYLLRRAGEWNADASPKTK